MLPLPLFPARLYSPYRPCANPTGSRVAHIRPLLANVGTSQQRLTPPRYRPCASTTGSSPTIPSTPAPASRRIIAA
jgi:hypothetical protein